MEKCCGTAPLQARSLLENIYQDTAKSKCFYVNNDTGYFIFCLTSVESQNYLYFDVTCKENQGHLHKYKTVQTLESLCASKGPVIKSSIKTNLQWKCIEITLYMHTQRHKIIAHFGLWNDVALPSWSNWPFAKLTHWSCMFWIFLLCSLEYVKDSNIRA